ncbi:unnamed protein product [Polarella glacialis]|uniref:Endonuclease/exonuclease/phosphatase domain-containing protein n=1 Tax=Polarella glacialis TaxID=89957 RepID=A0A813FBX9_POLGL|nr:unnamed protein product [Polarella glacialis]
MELPIWLMEAEPTSPPPESQLEQDWDECIEGLVHMRDAAASTHRSSHQDSGHEPRISVVTMNLRRYSAYPRNPEVGCRELVRIFGSGAHMPDVLCVQEGFEGTDVLAAVGYKRVSSSVLRSQALQDSVYGHRAELEAVNSSAHGRLLVNELYVRTDSAWEVIDSGASQISSDLMLDLGYLDDHEDALPSGPAPLATRSAVWAKLRHRRLPAGPFVYVLNLQLTGGVVEDGFFAGSLAQERQLQMQRVLDLFTGRLGVRQSDLAILAGDFYASRPEDLGNVDLRVPHDASTSAFAPHELYRSYGAYLASPFNVLLQRGWKFAYSQAQVGPTSPNGQLVDYMATNRTVSVTAQRLNASYAHLQSRMPDMVALSDRHFVMATFSLRAPEAPPEPVVSKPPDDAVLSKRLVAAVSSKRPPEAAHKDFPDGGFLPPAWASQRHLQAMHLGNALAAEKVSARLAVASHGLAPSSSFSPPARRTGRAQDLKCEHEDLVREHASEKQAAELMQAQLSSEMRELRDQCHEQGQTMGVLTQRLSDARGAVTAELQGAAAVRDELQSELLSQQSQHRGSQAALCREEAEAACRVEAVEEQLASMIAVRDSMQAQLRTSVQVQGELRAHIGAERDGRTALQVEGQKELERSWHEHHADGERSQVLGQLTAARMSREQLQCRLKAEAAEWQREAEELRELASEASEEAQGNRENARRLEAALGALASCEKPPLHEENQQSVESSTASGELLRGLNKNRKDLKTQLRDLKEDLLQLRQDHTATRIRAERDSLTMQAERESDRQLYLLEELETEKEPSGLFSCLFSSGSRQRTPPRFPPPSRYSQQAQKYPQFSQTPQRPLPISTGRPPASSQRSREERQADFISSKSSESEARRSRSTRPEPGPGSPKSSEGSAREAAPRKQLQEAVDSGGGVPASSFEESEEPRQQAPRTPHREEEEEEDPEERSGGRHGGVGLNPRPVPHEAAEEEDQDPPLFGGRRHERNVAGDRGGGRPPAVTFREDEEDDPQLRGSSRGKGDGRHPPQEDFVESDEV